MTPNIFVATASAWLGTLALLAGTTVQANTFANESARDNQVLEWNQVFIDTLIATNTPNSSSQRLGAIVHTAIFDAYNGIERRYTPILAHPNAPRGASPRAAVIAAAYTVLVGLFPSRQAELDASYAASLAALDEVDVGPSSWRAILWQSRQRGLAWGTEVATAVLAWRATDGFSVSYPPFTGGTAVGQWRPVPPATAMSAQGLAFTDMFVLASNSAVSTAGATNASERRVHRRLQRRQGAGSRNRLHAHCGADGARSFLGRERQCSLESGSEPDCARQPPLPFQGQSASRGVEPRDGGHGFHHLERQAILWRGSNGGDVAADHRHPDGRPRW